MASFDASTWMAVAGAAFTASAPMDQPGVHAQRFVPGRGVVVEGLSADPALERTGLNRRTLVARPAAPAAPPRVLRYEFGRRAVPLVRRVDEAGRLRPGLAVVALGERRNLNTGYCALENRPCSFFPAMRRLGLGVGYGDGAGLVSLNYFNDRIRLVGQQPREIDGVQLTWSRAYAWDWAQTPYAKPPYARP